MVTSHSTTLPTLTADRAERYHAAGLKYLHCPVFMGPQHCRDAAGLMLCSGPRARVARAESALKAMTGELWFLGERPDLAAAYKLFGNAMLLVIVGGLADVFQMGRQLGIPPPEAHALFARFKPAGVIDYRGKNMAEGRFQPMFELAMARKDVRLMLEAAGEAPLILLPALAASMDRAIARGRAHDDVGVLGADPA